jgi:hypothetical protein
MTAVQAHGTGDGSQAFRRTLWQRELSLAPRDPLLLTLNTFAAFSARQKAEPFFIPCPKGRAADWSPSRAAARVWERTLQAHLRLRCTLLSFHDPKQGKMIHSESQSASTFPSLSDALQ